MNTTRFLFLNSRDELYRVDISTIVYFEGEGNYTNFMLANKVKGSVCMNLAQMQAMLVESLHENASIFVRVGKRYIVNVNTIYHIEPLRQRLTLIDGGGMTHVLAISKEALKALKEVYVNALTTKGRKE